MPRATSAHLAPSQSVHPVESSSLSPVVCGILQWPLPLWSKKLHLNEVKVYFLRNQWQRPLTVPPSHPTLVYGSTGCAGQLVIFVSGIATEYEHTRGLGRGRDLGHDGVVAVARILKSNNFKNYTKVSLPENHCYLYSITTGGLSAARTSASRIRHISMTFAIVE